jgi:U3 small nucleolar RNA-associated protein 15
MDLDIAEYQKLQLKQYPARAERETAEGKYWRRFRAPSVVKQVLLVLQLP